MSAPAVSVYEDAESIEGLRRMEIVTPEGVPLHFLVASPGDRIWGFFIDCLLIALLLLGVAFFAGFFAAVGGPYLAQALFLVGFFLLRNFYFTWFEIRRQGSTPGKRRARTRVIDRHGRPLASGAIFVRNLTREIELFVPLAALSNPDAILGGGHAGMRVAAGVWFVGMALFPLVNRDRLRVGDLIAGTVVVRAPQAILSRDVAASNRRGTAYEFSPEQLDVYGIYELHVLEDLLRRPEQATPKTLRVVAEKIIDRIRWPGDTAKLDTKAFLRDFYAAQRTRLEQRMLFGERRERKRDADA